MKDMTLSLQDLRELESEKAEAAKAAKAGHPPVRKRRRRFITLKVLPISFIFISFLFINKKGTRRIFSGSKKEYPRGRIRQDR